MASFFGKGKKIDTSEKVEKKELNIWKNKVDIEIPEIEEDNRVTNVSSVKDEDPMATPFILNQKVDTLAELQKKSNTFNLESPNPDIDLNPLTEYLIPWNDIQEMDDTWEFHTLKNEIRVVITNIYGEVKNQDET